MAWRASHYAAAGALALGALGWAAREAWSGRRPITAPPIRVDRAYVGYVEALGRRETLADPLARAGIVGRDYSALLAAATHLPVRRLRAGLVFQFRRLATDSVADRVAVRLSPERLVRPERAGAGGGGGGTTEATSRSDPRPPREGGCGASVEERPR